METSHSRNKTLTVPLNRTERSLSFLLSLVRRVSSHLSFSPELRGPLTPPRKRERKERRWPKGPSVRSRTPYHGPGRLRLCPPGTSGRPEPRADGRMRAPCRSARRSGPGPAHERPGARPGPGPAGRGDLRCAGPSARATADGRPAPRARPESRQGPRPAAPPALAAAGPWASRRAPRPAAAPGRGPHLRGESRAVRGLPGPSAAAARRLPLRIGLRLRPLCAAHSRLAAPARPAERPLRPLSPRRGPGLSRWVRPEAPQPNNVPPHRPSPRRAAQQRALRLAGRGRGGGGARAARGGAAAAVRWAGTPCGPARASRGS